LTRLSLDSLRFDREKTKKEILRFIKTTIEDAKASGVVVGLSGGVDSTLTAALCVQALGKEKVLGVLMPTSFTPKQDIDDAVELAEMLGIETKKVEIDGICKSFIQAMEASVNAAANRIPLANIRARARMIILYYYANANNLLVAGTGDRSEYLIGFYTKHGDGAADFFPIIYLYKTQIRELAKYLGISERMAMKPSSPQLYPGHKLSDEVPLDYYKLDPVLVGLVDLRLPPEKVSEMADVPLEIVMEIVSRHKRSEHKRKLPPMVKTR
jgi:NAD+ synthase